MTIPTAEVRGWNRGRNNILLLCNLCSHEYNFVDKPHEKQVLYEGHTHRVMRLESVSGPVRNVYSSTQVCSIGKIHKHNSQRTTCLLTELGQPGRENIWPSVRTDCPLANKIFPHLAWPVTQSINEDYTKLSGCNTELFIILKRGVHMITRLVLLVFGWKRGQKETD